MLLLIRPAHFAFNMETVASNAFQQSSQDAENLHQKALKEFDALVDLLKINQIEHIVFEDTALPWKPDAIFPNNWFSTHEDGTIVLYPMLAANRRTERRKDIIDSLMNHYGYNRLIDLTYWEQEEKYLEGTGSLVLDRKLKYAYMCRSARSHKEVMDVFCKETGYEQFVFSATTKSGHEIYHTNVLMSIGSDVCVLAAEMIRNEDERKNLLAHLEQYYQLVLLTEEQVMEFAGNMLYVCNKQNKRYWLMSVRAQNTLTAEQKKILEQDGEILSTAIESIENNGGGSVRCMLAELV